MSTFGQIFEIDLFHNLQVRFCAAHLRHLLCFKWRAAPSCTCWGVSIMSVHIKRAKSTFSAS